MLLFIKDLANKHNVQLHIVESTYDNITVRSMVAYSKNLKGLVVFMDKASCCSHIATSVKEEDGYYYVILGLNSY